jgi:hypothetical protein
MKIACLLVLTALCGCSTTNITKMTEALAQDPANVDVEVRSPWGTVSFHRSNPGFSGTNSNAILVTPTTTLKSQPVQTK